MPGRNLAFGGAGLHLSQRLPSKIGLADGMLDDEPCGFGAIFPGNFLGGPATHGDPLAQASCMFAMDRLHRRNVTAAKLAGVEQLLANLKVPLPHGNQLGSQKLIDRHRYPADSSS